MTEEQTWAEALCGQPDTNGAVPVCEADFPDTELCTVPPYLVVLPGGFHNAIWR